MNLTRMDDLLQQEIDKARQEVFTDGYPTSIGELASMYETKDLVISPGYQRLYRWDIEKQSQLIESILIGIPLPSIFVYQRADAVWEVIDGLQRLSTIFSFLGILNGQPPSTLVGTKYLPSLQDRRWEGECGLSSIQQRLIKRSKIDVKIITRESSLTAKYEMFQRINSGGALLTDQEVRAAVMAMESESLLAKFKEAVSTDCFQSALNLVRRKSTLGYDGELAVRYIVLSRTTAEELKGIPALSSYLTEQIVELIQRPEQFESALSQMSSVFGMLRDALGDGCFRKQREDRTKHSGFQLVAFEVLAIGCSSWLLSEDERPDNWQEVLRNLAVNLWASEELKGKFGSGVRASSRLPYTIGYGRSAFRSA